MNKSTRFVITTLTGGRQEMVSDVIFTDLVEALTHAVNIADECMSHSKSSKKTLQVWDGEYPGQVKQIFCRYSAKSYDTKKYNIYDYDIYKETHLLVK